MVKSSYSIIKFSIFLFVAAIFMCGTSANAASDTKVVPRSAPRSVLSSMDLRAQATLFYSQMSELKNTEAETSQAGISANFDFKYTVNSNFSLQINPELRSNGSSRDANQKMFLEANEAQVQLKNSTQKIIIGFHRSLWEGTDFINPMDFVFAKNFIDPLNASSRPAAGVFFTQDFGGLNFELFYIPTQQKAVLPGIHSPWWPRQIYLPTQASNLELRLPDHVQYELGTEEVLDKALSNNWAFRLQKNFGSFDLSLAAFEGSSSTPILIPTIIVTPIEVSPREIYQMQNPITLNVSYFRSRAVGLSFSQVQGQGILRFATQHSQSIGSSESLPGWSDLSVLGYEYTFNLRKSDLVLLSQLVHSQKQENRGLSVLSSLMERAAMLGLRWPFQENWTWLAAFYQELKYNSALLHSELSWAHSDSIKSTLGMDFISGRVESPLGSYNKNTQLQYKFGYSF